MAQRGDPGEMLLGRQTWPGCASLSGPWLLPAADNSLRAAGPQSRAQDRAHLGVGSGRRLPKGAGE